MGITSNRAAINNFCVKLQYSLSNFQCGFGEEQIRALLEE